MAWVLAKEMVRLAFSEKALVGFVVIMLSLIFGWIYRLILIHVILGYIANNKPLASNSILSMVT